jgi:MFS transporter, PHS family, inorganic phosphate transporter
MIPLLSVLYPSSGATGESLGLMLNVSALLGATIGQLAFGLAADIYGRKASYGIELVLVIFGTMGMILISGTDGLSVLSWLLYWRFITGIGIGGGYPLSAVITAE